MFNLDLDRFCLPDKDDVKKVILEAYTSNGLAKYMGDAGTCWYIFLIMLGISFVLCLLYLILLRCFAKPILYISFILILALLGGGGAYVYC